MGLTLDFVDLFLLSPALNGKVGGPKGKLFICYLVFQLKQSAMKCLCKRKLKVEPVVRLQLLLNRFWSRAPNPPNREGEERKESIFVHLHLQLPYAKQPHHPT